MNLLHKFRPFTLHNIKYIRSPTLTLPRIVQFVHQLQSAAVSQPQKSDVIANLREKLCCTEYVAKNIYSKFPLLRSIDVIKNDTLELLRSNVSPQSIVENPILITMDVGEEQIGFSTFKRVSLLVQLFFRHFEEENRLVVFNGTKRAR